MAFVHDAAPGQFSICRPDGPEPYISHREKQRSANGKLAMQMTRTSPLDVVEIQQLVESEMASPEKVVLNP